MDAEKNKGSRRLTDYTRNRAIFHSSIIAAEAIITPDFPLNQFAIRDSPLPPSGPFFSRLFVPHNNKRRRRRRRRQSRRAEIIKGQRREANLNKRYVTIPIFGMHAKVKEAKATGMATHFRHGNNAELALKSSWETSQHQILRLQRMKQKIHGEGSQWMTALKYMCMCCQGFLPTFGVGNDSNEKTDPTAAPFQRIAGRILAWSLCGGENERST